MAITNNPGHSTCRTHSVISRLLSLLLSLDLGGFGGGGLFGALSPRVAADMPNGKCGFVNADLFRPLEPDTSPNQVAPCPTDFRFCADLHTLALNDQRRFLHRSVKTIFSPLTTTTRRS